MSIKDHIAGLIEKRQQLADDMENIVQADDYDPDGVSGTEFREMQREADTIDKRIAHGTEVAELRSKANALMTTTGHYPNTADPSLDIGEQLVSSPAWRNYVRSGASGRAKLMEIPMRRALITSATWPLGESAKVLAPNPNIPNRLLNALTRIQVASGSVDVIAYGPDPLGTVTPEGALKTEGVFAPTITPHTVPTIASWSEAVRQVIEDETRLRDFITNSLMRGVYKKAENDAVEVIEAGVGYGTATGANGMAAIKNGVATVQTAGWDPNAIILNPLDAAALDYNVWDNTGGQSSSIWGLQVIPAAGIASGTGFVADVSAAFAHYYRGSADVYVSDSDVGIDGVSNFKRNILTFLVEYRGLTVVVRPDAVAKVSITPPLPLAAAAPQSRTKS